MAGFCESKPAAVCLAHVDLTQPVNDGLFGPAPEGAKCSGILCLGLRSREQVTGAGSVCSYPRTLGP